MKALLAELDISSSGTGEEEFPYRFYVSDLADEFKDFANSILPYDVSMAKKNRHRKILRSGGADR